MGTLLKLSQKDLVEMDSDDPEIIDDLKSIAEIVVECVHGDRMEFAMEMVKRLLDIYAIRMYQGDCPAEVFQFVADVSGHLWMRQDLEHLVLLFKMACRVHSNVCTLDTNLLVSVIGCSLPMETPQFTVSFGYITRAHNVLLSTLRGNAGFVIKKLMVTTRLIYVFAAKEEAVQLLRDAYNKILHFLDHNDRKFNFFANCYLRRMKSE